LRRDILVLRGFSPDAFVEGGVRADEDDFVIRRGWEKDILNGQISRSMKMDTAAGLGLDQPCSMLDYATVVQRES
jgi:hypothetical protein